MSRSAPPDSNSSLEAISRALDDAALQQASSAAVFERGRTYALSGAVQVTAEEREPRPAIHAQVAGTQTYTTEVWMDEAGVDGDCNCAHAADGWFCKHQVAVALIWRDRLSGVASPIDDAARAKVQASAKRAKTVRDNRDALRTYLHAQPVAVLADKLMELADRDSSITRELQHWRKIDQAPSRSADLKPLVTEILSRGRGFIDWRESSDYARRAEAVLPLLRKARERDADAAASLALHAMRRLWSVLEQADDSNGVIGDVASAVGAEWVAALQAQGPRPAAFGDTYLKLQLEDPFGTFDSAQAEAAIGGPALERYRRALADRWREAHDAVQALKAAQPHKARTNRYQFQFGSDGSEAEMTLRSLTRLHLHELEAVGDIDGALAVLRADLSHPIAYAAVTRYLLQHDRPRDAFANAEQACRAFPDDRHLEDDLLQCYERDGWTAEALALHRRQFDREPSVERYRAVVKASVAAGKDEAAVRAELMQALEAHEVSEMSRRRGPVQLGRHRGASAARDVSLRAAVLCAENRWIEACALVRPPAVAASNVLRHIALHLDDAHREQAITLLLRVFRSAMDVANTPYREELAVVREIAERMEPARRAAWLAELRVQFKAKRNFIRDLPKDG